MFSLIQFTLTIKKFQTKSCKCITFISVWLLLLSWNILAEFYRIGVIGILSSNACACLVICNLHINIHNILIYHTIHVHRIWSMQLRCQYIILQDRSLFYLWIWKISKNTDVVGGNERSRPAQIYCILFPVSPYPDMP